MCMRNLSIYVVKILHFNQKTGFILSFVILHKYSTLHRYCDEILCLTECKYDYDGTDNM